VRELGRGRAACRGDAPRVVVHLGDATVDGANDARDLDFARSRLDELPVAWHAIPGNHDVGDNPVDGSTDEHVIDDARRDRWRAAVGDDWWSFDHDGWTFIAVNARLFGSGLAAEEAQWDWLAQQFARLPDAARIALLTHKPLTADAAELASAPPYRFVHPTARVRLDTLAGGRAPDLVLSGHVHQYRELDINRAHHVWAPTTWAVLPDDFQASVGRKRCGVVELELAADGGPFSVSLGEPPGLAQFVLRDDVANPYDDGSEPMAVS
jgi:hypothetical protein